MRAAGAHATRTTGEGEKKWTAGLEAGLQAVKGAGGAGGGRRFTGVDGQVDAAVDGVVVLVGRRGLAGELAPPAGGVFVRVVDEGDAGRGVLYPKLGVRHEVVDGRSGVGLLQAFVEGATERVDNSDLSCRRGGGAGEGGEKGTVRGGAQRGEVGTLRDRRWGREGGGGRELGEGGRENLGGGGGGGCQRREREATAVCAPLSHETTTVHKSLSLVVQLREAVRDTIRKKINK